MRMPMTDVAVLVIDMMNTYSHPDAETLSRHVAEIIDPLAGLVAKARERDEVALIYVNDNYGDFTAQFSDLVQAALHGERPDLIEPIAPGEGCKVMTKVRHSAFYATSLAYLLGQMEPRHVVLTGQVTEQCILYTALDAYVRHFPVVVPHDAVAHIDPELRDAALTMMHRNMSAEIISAADCLD
jgi:nicotinamidase-related amidase